MLAKGQWPKADYVILLRLFLHDRERGSMKRRDFLSGLALTSASLAAGQATNSTDGQKPQGSSASQPAGHAKNVIICARNGELGATAPVVVGLEMNSFKNPTTVDFNTLYFRFLTGRRMQ